jgi:hypothetical protein
MGFLARSVVWRFCCVCCKRCLSIVSTFRQLSLIPKTCHLRSKREWNQSGVGESFRAMLITVTRICLVLFDDIHLSFRVIRLLVTYHATPLYPQKLALTSPTGGGRSVGMVRSRTKAKELVSNKQVSMVEEWYVFKTPQDWWKPEDPQRPNMYDVSRRMLLHLPSVSLRLLTLFLIPDMPRSSGDHGEGDQPKQKHETRALSWLREVPSISHSFIRPAFLLLLLNLKSNIFIFILPATDRLCGLVVRVLGYRSGGPGSIPGTTRKKK